MVKAQDPDYGINAQISYSISNITATLTPKASLSRFGIYWPNGDRNRVAFPFTFRIDPTSGKIFANESYDRETVEEYWIRVTMTDNGKKPLSSNAIVRVKVSREQIIVELPDFLNFLALFFGFYYINFLCQILDFEDNIPHFDQRTYYFTREEDYTPLGVRDLLQVQQLNKNFSQEKNNFQLVNMSFCPGGHIKYIGTVYATDDDVDQSNKRIVYSIEEIEVIPHERAATREDYETYSNAKIEFSITVAGLIFSCGYLDRETASQYIIHLMADNWNSKGASDSSAFQSQAKEKKSISRRREEYMIARGKSKALANVQILDRLLLFSFGKY